MVQAIFFSTHVLGGQKALATLALSFAINKVFPSPFYLLDEVDAALDSLAVERVAQYIKQVFPLHPFPKSLT